MDAFIFLHGKQGGPANDECMLGQLSEEFSNNGHLVSYKTYPWGYNNLFTDFAQSVVPLVLAEVENLKGQGATRIHLVGFSLGANLSLYCVSNSPDLFKSIILLAPAHNIHLSVYEQFISKSLQLGNDLIASGRGNMVHHFVDFNMAKKINVPALPVHYISYLAKTGPCNMENSIAEIKSPIHALMVSGTNDTTQRVAEYKIWQPLNKTVHSQLVTTNDSHNETCLLKYNLIHDWVKTLP